MKDLDIRTALHEKFKIQYDCNSRIVDELGINRGRVRIDVAVINGTINGFEIKSEQDTLERLPTQADIYNSVFDHLTIILNKAHHKKALEIIPEWWGILMAFEKKGKVLFKKIRDAQQNEFQDKRIMVELLWKDEALNLLAIHDLHKGMKSKNRNQIWDKLAEHLSLNEIRSHVLKVLKERDNWRSD